MAQPRFTHKDVVRYAVAEMETAVDSLLATINSAERIKFEAAELGAHRAQILDIRDRWFNQGGPVEAAVAATSRGRNARKRGGGGDDEGSEEEGPDKRVAAVDHIGQSIPAVSVETSVKSLLRELNILDQRVVQSLAPVDPGMVAKLRGAINNLLGQLKETPAELTDYGSAVDKERANAASYFSRLPRDITTYVIAPKVNEPVAFVDSPQWTVVADSTRLTAILARDFPTPDPWLVYACRLVYRSGRQPLAVAAVLCREHNGVVVRWNPADESEPATTLSLGRQTKRSPHIGGVGPFRPIMYAIDELGNIVILGFPPDEIGGGPDALPVPAAIGLFEVRPNGVVEVITQHPSFVDAVELIMSGRMNLSAYGGRYAIGRRSVDDDGSLTLVFTRPASSEPGDDSVPWTVDRLDIKHCELVAENYLHSVGPGVQQESFRIYRLTPGQSSLAAEPVLNLKVPLGFNAQEASITASPLRDGTLVASRRGPLADWKLLASVRQ